ncbi:TPA: hypothetical protein HA251_06395 [Candidatus Woesearchaeota archaeon]|nr:hypothetical protein [Candidatus Woesearchaeota archaeon]
MASAATWIAAVLIIGMVGLGVAQNLNLPHSTLAGAVPTTPKTQQEINLCMQSCMLPCVDKPGTEISCLEHCNGVCGVSTP